MEIKKYFFDTYAFFEIIEGNKSYAPYKNSGIITTKLNLMELHYGILRKYGRQKADEYYDRLLPFAIEITDRVIKEANQLKSSVHKRDLSYVDCIGYILAKVMGTKFLTGDKEFEDLDNVEFIK
jgi:uncharacterized protein